jgi:hypothetical protein
MLTYVKVPTLLGFPPVAATSAVKVRLFPYVLGWDPAVRAKVVVEPRPLILTTEGPRMILLRAARNVL